MSDSKSLTSSSGESGPPRSTGPEPSLTSSVAIVGRPNVGKSTLFNRLVGRRQAIVHDTPGVTRDRITGTLTLEDDRRVELIDTGGLVPGDDSIGLNAQVLMAVEECDLVILLVDGKEGLVPADEQVWQEIRVYDRPAILAVNKADTRAAQSSFDEFYGLGIAPQLLVSAEHGLGMEDLRTEIAAAVPETEPVAAAASALAIVGRPNVGKSSLLNRLVGRERALVSPTAGTTRDPVDTVLEGPDGESYLLIDTAGIRRRSQVSGVPEELAVMMARRQIERAQVGVLVVDAERGLTTGDLAIAGSIWEFGRGAVVAINKWDLLDEEKREDLEASWPRLDEILSSPPRVNVSAATGRGIDKLLPAVAGVLERFRREVPTSELNEILEMAVARHHAPAYKGRPWKLYYATQVAIEPPTFMLFANRSLPRQDSYRRYLENQLRQALDLSGVPLRLVIRRREQAKP